jgi:hypothetical protein
MPLNQISNTLHSILSVRLNNKLTGTLLEQLFHQTHSFASKNLGSVVPEIIANLNTAQSISKTWSVSNSKELFTYSSQAAFNPTALAKMSEELIQKLEDLSNKLNSIMGLLNTETQEIGSLLDEAYSDENEVKSDPGLLIGTAILGAANTLISGTTSLGNSIGHFFTHGSFSHVGSSPGNQYAMMFERESIMSIEHLIRLLHTSQAAYNQLMALITHVNHCLNDAQRALEQFLNATEGLTTATASSDANRALSSIGNALHPIDSIVNDAFGF